MTWGTTVGLVVMGLLLVSLAIGVALRERLPKCSPAQASEVRSIARECLIHTIDGVDDCYSKAKYFTGCTP